MKRNLWSIQTLHPHCQVLAKEFKLNPYLIQVLLNRRIPKESFNSFLYPLTKSFHSPELLPDIETGAQRIKQAVSRNEKIFVLGDYDVDGVTSIAIFHEYAKANRNLFTYYIPHRTQEGYGFSEEALHEAKNSGCTLLIAFDCATNALKEVALAKELGIDVVVIDHHLPKDKPAKPLALINPKRADSSYPFSDLSSGALSFKLLQVLTGSECRDVLDLVALSIVCDVAPLCGENRDLVREGLAVLRTTERPAIQALVRVGSIKQPNIDTFHIGFILGPRINASGRIAHAHDSLDLFLAENYEEAYICAKRLSDHNVLRKNIEAQILKEAEIKVGEQSNQGHSIVVSGDDWHPGVLGIVASRLAGKYQRPSFVISFDQGVGVGSARSVECVHLIEMLDQCADMLIQYGGHKKAAGVQINKDELENFKERLNELISENSKQEDFVPLLSIDAEISFRDITLQLADELMLLKPYGEGNQKPLFISQGVSKRGAKKKVPFGYSLWLTAHGMTYEACIYSKGLVDILNSGEKFDIVFSIEKNAYHNIPRLALRDCRLSDRDR